MNKLEGIVLHGLFELQGDLLRDREKTVPCDLVGASCPRLLTSFRRIRRELPGRLWQFSTKGHLGSLSTSNTTLSSLFVAMALHVASWASSLSFPNAKSNFLFDSSQSPMESGFEDWVRNATRELQGLR